MSTPIHTTPSGDNAPADSSNGNSFAVWLAVAIVGFPAVWIGSSLILGKLTGTDVGYDQILSVSDWRVLVFRVAIPQALALAGSLWWARRRLPLRDVYIQDSVKRTWPPVIGVVGVLGFFGILVSQKISQGVTLNGTLLVLLASTMIVGFAEETMYRGAILQACRRKGLTEFASFAVMALSFGAMHLPNVFLGQPVQETLVQFIATIIVGGIGFYCVLRVTRRLAVPAVLHGLWDFTVGLG